MNAPHYLCSELVSLEYEEIRSVVNLEEIWATGAVIECETPMEAGLRFRLLAANCTFLAVAILVMPHEFGCRVEVEFSPETPWNPDAYSPQHLMNLSILGSGSAG